MGVGQGDRLARGARSAQFAAGKTKKGDKVQINPGTLMSDAARKELEKSTQAFADSIAADPSFAPAKLKSKLIPLYDRVIIRKTQELDRTKGGIFIPEDAKDRPFEGTVLYVGFGRLVDGEIRPLYLKGGEKVLFGKYAGTEAKVDGEVVLLMREDEILAIISEADVNTQPSKTQS
jgi:chaperonin GroES